MYERRHAACHDQLGHADHRAPDLERSLHTSLLTLVWVILVYMIASTVLVLSAGRLSDQFGRKNAYIGGFILSLWPRSAPASRAAAPS